MAYNRLRHVTSSLNPSPHGQDGRHFADNSFRYNFVNEKLGILIKISLKFVPNHSIDNNPALVKMMAWRENRRQAIIWTDADQIHWHIYAALGGDELTEWMLTYSQLDT